MPPPLTPAITGDRVISAIWGTAAEAGPAAEQQQQEEGEEVERTAAEAGQTNLFLAARLQGTGRRCAPPHPRHMDRLSSDTVARITSDCDAMRSPADQNGPNHLGVPFCRARAGAVLKVGHSVQLAEACRGAGCNPPLPGCLAGDAGECCCPCSTHGLSSNTTALITSGCAHMDYRLTRRP